MIGSSADDVPSNSASNQWKQMEVSRNPDLSLTFTFSGTGITHSQNLGVPVASSTPHPTSKQAAGLSHTYARSHQLSAPTCPQPLGSFVSHPSAVLVCQALSKPRGSAGSKPDADACLCSLPVSGATILSQPQQRCMGSCFGSATCNPFPTAPTRPHHSPLKSLRALGGGHAVAPAQQCPL